MTTYNATSYTSNGPYIGTQPINSTSTTQKHPIGFILTAVDPNYGEGTFMYGPGVANTAVGSVVTLITQDAGNGSTALANAQHGNLGVAMSANVAGQYGWYQVEGYNPNVLATGTAAAGDPAYIDTGAAGTITSTSSSNTATVGMLIVTAVSNGVAGCQLTNPTF